MLAQKQINERLFRPPISPTFLSIDAGLHATQHVPGLIAAYVRQQTDRVTPSA
ncbi:hypothetical protein [Thiobacillus sp.]|uniref:hypothetical protein n=1 Tax=Thiobacillus sp. TaxID=924 RepID=UPI00286E3E1D|nr:hypothetical protein [Thiobacillus sp.]